MLPTFGHTIPSVCYVQFIIDWPVANVANMPKAVITSSCCSQYLPQQLVLYWNTLTNQLAPSFDLSRSSVTSRKQLAPQRCVVCIAEAGRESRIISERALEENSCSVYMTYMVCCCQFIFLNLLVNSIST